MNQYTKAQLHYSINLEGRSSEFMMQGLSAEQERLVARLLELQTADDWRDIAALERTALPLARNVLRAMAGAIYSVLGDAYDSLGDFSRAIEYHTQHLAIAKEVGDLVGEGTAYGNLGSVYDSLGDFSRAIEYHTQHLAIAKEVGDRAGEGTAYGNLGSVYDSLVTFSGRSSITRSAWRLPRR
jgi:tetratricopeptide (TPR) repeat protein